MSEPGAGDIVAILDDTGAKVVNYTYDAWGTPVSTSGTMAGTLGVLQPFRYRGYVYDYDIGLYYLRNRYYNHKIVRFINEDCILNSNMLGTNAFTYCINKPINVLDTNGTEGEEYGHYAYIWENNTFIVDSGFNPKIKAILGEKVLIVEHWNGDDNWYHIQYLSDNRIVDGYVPSENVIVWYGFGTAGIDTFVKEYFKGFFNNSKNFLHTGTDWRKKAQRYAFYCMNMIKCMIMVIIMIHIYVLDMIIIWKRQLEQCKVILD